MPLPLSGGDGKPDCILFPRDLPLDPGWVRQLYEKRPWRGWSSEDSGGPCVVWPGREPLSTEKPPKVGVVLAAYNKPDRTVPCIESILGRTQYPNFELFIIDDGGDAFTHQTLEAYKDRATVLRHRNCGYLLTANRGAREAFGAGCDIVVFVNSDVRVTCGWLSAMVRAHLVTGADLVNPFCNQQGPLSLPLAGEMSWNMPRVEGGRSYLDVALAASFIPPKYPNAVTNIGQCMLVTKGAWTEHGPFDSELYGRGYGEECELWARVVTNDGIGIVADDAYVFHESHAVHEDAPARERRGADKFMERWGDLYKERSPAIRVWSSKTNNVRCVTNTLKPSGCPVRFVLVNIGPYGGVHCIIRLVDELKERGFDATAEFTKHEDNTFRPTTGPNRHVDINAMRRISKDDRCQEGFIVGTHWFTGEVLAATYEISSNFIPLAFWQDREDLFTEPNGRRSVRAGSVTAYLRIPNRIVNAEWVGSSAVEELGIDGFEHIPVGVDTLKFYPGERNGGQIRILVMHRPSTPRRGAVRMRKLFPKLKAELGDSVLIETFGEDCGWSDHHYGRLSQDGVADLLRQVDILVEPSEYQGFGLPGLEALATGICLVSTNNKGVHEYGAHEENCLIEGDFSLRELVVMAVQDRALRLRLGAQGRQTALAFDWSVIADKWAAHLKTLYLRSGMTRYVDTFGRPC